MAPSALGTAIGAYDNANYACVPPSCLWIDNCDAGSSGMGWTGRVKAYTPTAKAIKDFHDCNEFN